MAREVHFKKRINFPDGAELEIDFTATIVMGGIGAYEFWGQRCTQSQEELDEIDFDKTGLTKEQIEFIDDVFIDSQELADAAYEAMR
jgi:hypothetical protein